MSKRYKIAILLSSYNGEQYIEEQIKSIMNQVGCEVILVIRDDGSKDRTVDVVKRLQKNYSERIILHCGENLGYRRSFMELRKKMKLLKNKKLTSGVLVCDMEAKLKIVMKNF